MAIIQKEKMHLAEGKRVLTELGYNCEIGANDLFVYLQAGTADNYNDIKVIEKDLTETSGCKVWVIGG